METDMKRIAIAFALAVSIVGVTSAQAQCTCNAQTLIVSPSYSVFSVTDPTPTGTLTISCPGNTGGNNQNGNCVNNVCSTDVNIAISPGLSGSYANRQLQQISGTDLLNFNIFTDGGRGTIWAATNAKSYNLPAGSNTINENLYLKFTAGQDVAFSGTNYQDNFTVTLSWGGVNRSCTLQIQIPVLAECKAPLATLSFGGYTAVAATPLDVNAALLYNCTKGVSPIITLDNGQNWNGATRRMIGPGANYLNYQIYRETGRTTIWNTVNTVSAASTSKNTPLGGVSGLPVFGRIPIGQDVNSGAYGDSVTATVNY
jgi:spore coat protein U-like protein